VIAPPKSLAAPSGTETTQGDLDALVSEARREV
jgi:hypothetical protein